MSRAEPVSGYMILARCSSAYRGVERPKFEPEFPELATVKSDWKYPPDVAASRIWPFWPEDSWQRDAYRLYEENSVVLPDKDLFLLADLEAARHLLQVAEQRVFGVHGAEVLHCHLLEDEASPLAGIGVDAAFAGGDYFSLVRLLVEQKIGSPLQERYGGLLNSTGLLQDPDTAGRLIADFQRTHPSHSREGLFGRWLLCNAF